MDSEPSQLRDQAASASLAARLSPLLQQHLLARYVTGGMLIWVWVTILRFTLSLSNDVALSGLRSMPYSQPGFIAFIAGGFAIATLIPLVFAWNALLRFTNLVVKYIGAFIPGGGAEANAAGPPGRSVASDSQRIAREEELRDQLIQSLLAFKRWFYAFASVWLLMTLGGVAQTTAMLVLNWISGNSGSSGSSF